jgi:hypothetical protein
MDLSVIIVNYKTKDLTLNTLATVMAARRPKQKLEVILVDNASNDGTPAAVSRRFPAIKVIESKINLGFASGNNLGLRQAKGRYLLLLNSDTLINKDTLVKMVKFMDENPKVGLATCRVELADGRIDPASHRGFPTPWAAITYYLGLEKLWPKSRLFGRYHQGWQDLSQIHEIDCPTGAFFFIRRQVIRQIGLLDEGFFMYGEDIDFSYRVKQAGWQVMYAPITRIIHLKGASGMKKQVKNKLTPEARALRLKITRAFFDNNRRLYQKHFAKGQRLTAWLYYLGIEILKQIKLAKVRLS